MNSFSGQQVREIKNALDFLSHGLLPQAPGMNDGYDLAVFFAGHIATLLDLQFVPPRSVFQAIAEQNFGRAA